MPDKTIVPTNFQTWPIFKGLSLLARLVARELWCNNFINASGCFHLPVEMFAACLSISEEECTNAILELDQRKAIEFDQTTEEILIVGWWRFHKCDSAIQKKMVMRGIEDIKSKKLKKKLMAAMKKAGISLNNNILTTNTTKQKHIFNQSQHTPSPPTSNPASGGEGGGDTTATESGNTLSGEEGDGGIADVNALTDVILWEDPVTPYQSLVMKIANGRPLAEVQLLADEFCVRLAQSDDPLNNVEGWLHWKVSNLAFPSPRALAIQHARHQKYKKDEAGPL